MRIKFILFWCTCDCHYFLYTRALEKNGKGSIDEGDEDEEEISEEKENIEEKQTTEEPSDTNNTTSTGNNNGRRKSSPTEQQQQQQEQQQQQPVVETPRVPVNVPNTERVKPKGALLPTPSTKPLTLPIVTRTPSLSTAATTSMSTSWPRVSNVAVSNTLSLTTVKTPVSSPRKGGKMKDEGWKEVGKRYNV